MLQRTMVAQFRLISFVDLGQFRAEPRTRTILDMHMHTGYIPYSFPKLCSLEVISSSLSCAASRLQTFLLVRSGLVQSRHTGDGPGPPGVGARVLPALDVTLVSNKVCFGSTRGCAYSLLFGVGARHTDTGTGAGTK